MAFPPSWKKYLVRGTEELSKVSQFMLRAPYGLKGRAVKCSRIRNMKLTPWLIEAIEEKCQREEKENNHE